MFNRGGKVVYHRGEKYASNAKDEEETRFARDRFSLPTGGDSDGSDRSRADGGKKNLERSWVASRERERKREREREREREKERKRKRGGTGMPVNVVNRIPRNLCVIYGDLRRAV